MKRLPFPRRFTPALLALAGTAAAAIAGPYGPLPDDKGYTPLREGEKNPYERPVVKEEKAIEQAETEETKLRSMLGAMPVAGVRDNGYQIRVLLGSMMLTEGDELPPLLPQQQEKLKVGEILPDQIELVFVEREEEVEPRRIEIPVRLDPKVTYAIGPRSDAKRVPPSGGPTAVYPPDEPKPEEELE